MLISPFHHLSLIIKPAKYVSRTCFDVLTNSENCGFAIGSKKFEVSIASASGELLSKSAGVLVIESVFYLSLYNMSNYLCIANMAFNALLWKKNIYLID